MRQQGFMLNAQEIDYANCNLLESQNSKTYRAMGEFEYARSVVLNNCRRIASYMGIESKASLATTDVNHKTWLEASFKALCSESFITASREYSQTS